MQYHNSFLEILYYRVRAEVFNMVIDPGKD